MTETRNGKWTMNAWLLSGSQTVVQVNRTDDRNKFCNLSMLFTAVYILVWTCDMVSNDWGKNRIDLKRKVNSFSISDNFCIRPIGSGCRLECAKQWINVPLRTEVPFKRRSPECCLLIRFNSRSYKITWIKKTLLPRLKWMTSRHEDLLIRGSRYKWISECKKW